MISSRHPGSILHMLQAKNFARVAALLLTGSALALASFRPTQRVCWMQITSLVPSSESSMSNGSMGRSPGRLLRPLPILGKYTTDTATVARHYEAFQQLGIDWLLIDWSNMLWTKPAWEQHTGETQRLEEKTAVLFQTAVQLHREGKYAPKLVFMVGLQNGPPVPNGVARLNGMLAWLKANYLDRPEYKDLWLYDGGKPLLTILYWPPDPCAQLPKDLAANTLHAEDWTVRWMATQLQDNHAEQCGMWSWMDGVIPQVLTRHEGKPEEIVVTPSAFRFPAKGWTAPSAIARDHGVPYLESWKAAFVYRPKFIQVHQWNEFAGQENGHGMPLDYWGQGAAKVKGAEVKEAYGDEYNLQLSDDIEPTVLQACAYRGCGGWGYYYYNLTRAIISLYRGATPGITVLALSGPATAVKTSIRTIDLHWAYLGKEPSSFAVELDGKVVAPALTGSEYKLDLSQIKPGSHHVRLTAAECIRTFRWTRRMRRTSPRKSFRSSPRSVSITAPLTRPSENASFQ